ncbi:MAG: N-acetylmuramoyl-L-alanine amidase [Endomicrobium sp.]|jgi:N-acetylmuramoyl-L-alanine amidase|nr:N-acetylmuramoyl-L-alanine amidase [Endomicrobium sp.]
MKRIIYLFFSVFILFFFIFSYVTADNFPALQNVNATLDGSPFPGIRAYRVSHDTYYFSIKELAKLYNALLEWKPVSSKVTMYLKDKKIDIKADSSEVVFSRIPKRMSLPSRLIENNIYIPPEIITSEEFADAVDAETSWNPSSFTLVVNRCVNISEVKCFTKEETTQVCIQLDKPARYTVLKSEDRITLTIARGKIKTGSIDVNNGTVRDISCKTADSSAVIAVNLEQTSVDIKTIDSVKPSGIIIDIKRSINTPVDHGNNIGVKSDNLSTDNNPNSTDLDLTPPEKFGESNITEFDYITENDDENKDLKSLPVTVFDSDKIADNSHMIVDDAYTVPKIVVKKQNKNKKKARKKIIVIDAGHGGEDPGAVGANGTKEKDLNLSIAYELKSIFDKDDDFEIVLTRKDDTFIPLAERANIANEHNADLFISIHCNANLNRDASGFEVYFLSEQATDSEAAATAVLENSVLELEGRPSKKRVILQEMLWSMAMNEYMNESSELSAFIAYQANDKLKIPSRGVKQASFYVLRGTQMPSVLVESAFLSNGGEEAKLSTENFRASVAASIYEGVISYYDKKERDQNAKK